MLHFQVDIEHKMQEKEKKENTDVIFLCQTRNFGFQVFLQKIPGGFKLKDQRAFSQMESQGEGPRGAPVGFSYKKDNQQRSSRMI